MTANRSERRRAAPRRAAPPGEAARSDASGEAFTPSGAFAQFARYGAVGVLGTALHFGITVALVDGAGAPPVAASAAGFLVAFVVQYALNRAWVFASGVGLWRGLARYAAVCALGLALNVAIMYAATAVLGLHYLWGLVAVVAVVPLSNFTLNRLWTFARPTGAR